MTSPDDDVGSTPPGDLASPASDDAYLAARYGTRRPSRAARRSLVAALVLLAAGGLGTVVWIGLGMANQPVRWQDVGYAVHDAQEVETTFDVIMAPGTVANCRLHALNSQFAEVGAVDVVVGPDEERQVRHRARFATAEEAVTALVDWCETVDQ